jgi:hypothetical protein
VACLVSAWVGCLDLELHPNPGRRNLSARVSWKLLFNFLIRTRDSWRKIIWNPKRRIYPNYIYSTLQYPLQAPEILFHDQHEHIVRNIWFDNAISLFSTNAWTQTQHIEYVKQTELTLIIISETIKIQSLCSRLKLIYNTAVQKLQKQKACCNIPNTPNYPMTQIKRIIHPSYAKIL